MKSTNSKSRGIRGNGETQIPTPANSHVRRGGWSVGAPCDCDRCRNVFYNADREKIAKREMRQEIDEFVD